MSRIFLRSYQHDAIEKIFSIFVALGSEEKSSKITRRTSPVQFALESAKLSSSIDPATAGALLDRLKQRVTIVCAPTASGKTLMMKGIADKLAELGVFTLVLTYASTVAAQNRAAGLAASTVQKFFWAFETAATSGLGAKEARHFVAQHLELPEVFLDDQVAVLVDESHLGLENMAQIYDKVLSFLSNARMIVGFTATPRWREYFNLIDLSQQVAEHVAAPRGSIIHSQWLGSLPQQALLFPRPMLVFARSVLSAAVLTMAFRLTVGGSHCGLVVANGRKVIEELVLRFLLRQSGQENSVENQEEDDVGINHSDSGDNHTLSGSVVSLAGYQRAELLHGSSQSDTKIDFMERRFGLVVMLLVLNAWSQKQLHMGAALLQEFGIVYGQIPRFAQAMRLLRKYLPETASDIALAMANGDPAAATRVARQAAAVDVLQGVNPADFARGKIEIGISVYKIATGFNLPELRTVLFAEAVVGSRVLYEQRAGRGARKVAGKGFYDLVEVQYLDSYSDLAFGAGGVSWRRIFLRDPSVRRALAQADLVFRYPCSPLGRDD